MDKDCICEALLRTYRLIETHIKNIDKNIERVACRSNNTKTIIAYNKIINLMTEKDVLTNTKIILDKAFEKLNMEDVFLKFKYNMTYQQLAGLLGISESALAHRFSRARKKLYEIILSRHKIEFYERQIKNSLLLRIAYNKMLRLKEAERLNDMRD